MRSFPPRYVMRYLGFKLLNKSSKFWTSANSFVASANCGELCGAKLDLVDISLKDFNISMDIIKKKLKEKNKPKVIIPVHLAGYPCDLKKLHDLTKKFKIKILEDASHAFGTNYFRNKIGCCKYSDIADFKKNNNIYYEQQVLGYNYRLSDLHATLGLSQLKKLNIFNKIRNKIKKRYDIELKKLPLIFPDYKKNIKFSNHLYVVMINPLKTGKKRDQLITYLQKKGIITSIHYLPIYKHPYFKKYNFNQRKFKNSNFYYEHAISLPIYPDLTKKKQEYIIKCIKKFFQNNK